MKPTADELDTLKPGQLVGEFRPMELISNTKQEKQIRATLRYARLTFFGALIYFSGLGELVITKAPALFNVAGEFLINLSGK